MQPPSAQPIPLITSIPGGLHRVSNGKSVGPSYLQQCVDSWFAAGFQPISVNAQRELDEGLVLPRAVDSVAAREDARELTGRPLVFLRDLLRTGCAATESVFVITNADVRLAPSPRLMAEIRALPVGHALIARRVDVMDHESQDGVAYPDGFDFFALHASDAVRLPDFGLVFGVPWWDHWLPTTLALSNVDVRVEHEPFAFHLWHRDRWDEPTWYRLGERYASQLSPFAVRAKLQTPSAQLLREEVLKAVRGRDPLRRLARAVFGRLGLRRGVIRERALLALSNSANEHFDRYAQRGRGDV